MASAMKIVFGLLTFVTFGMIIGALFQLAFIRRLEDSYGTESSFRRTLEDQSDSNSQAIREWIIGITSGLVIYKSARENGLSVVILHKSKEENRVLRFSVLLFDTLAAYFSGMMSASQEIQNIPNDVKKILFTTTEWIQFCYDLKYLKHAAKSTFLPFRRLSELFGGTILVLFMLFTDTILVSGYSHLAHDREAVVLRLGYVKPEILSWAPRIILFHNFLSNEECDYLRAIALPRLQVSTVVDAKTGKGIKSNVRTSSGMFLSHEEKKYPMIQAIEKRISVYSQIPVENGELLQVLRYEKDQFYRPHHDYFSDTFNLKRGGQRVATMLMYLSDNVEGGETYFPMAGSGECSCGGKMVPGLCVKPAKGDAVLFWSMGLDGKSDPNSIHGGCEVLSGEKWSATKWMRQRVTS